MSAKRAELRRVEKEEQKRQHKKDAIAKSLNMTKGELEIFTEMIREEAVESTLVLLFAIPAMVVHDKYAQLMKKVDNGKTREERFIDLCLEAYEAYEKGYFSIEDARKVLKEEGGVDFEKVAERRAAEKEVQKNSSGD